MPREPQSYGSNEEWVSGKSDQKVNDPKSLTAPEHQEFYDERRESETSAPHQGGHTSNVQLADTVAPVSPAREEGNPSTGVNTHGGGAKRDSYFRKRDYE